MEAKTKQLDSFNWLHATIASILIMMLWCTDSAAALKYNGYRLEFSLAEHLEKDGLYWKGGFVCECTG